MTISAGYASLREVRPDESAAESLPLRLAPPSRARVPLQGRQPETGSPALEDQAKLNRGSAPCPPVKTCRWPWTSRTFSIQRLLGSDIQMVLDECPAFGADEADLEKSLDLSMRWAKRSRAAFGEQPARACFGIVQGGVFPRLRERSAAELQEIGFDGGAVGGLAVGEGQTAMFETLEATVPYLPSDQPRYLMGVGKPDDIVGAVRRGDRHVRLRAADALRPKWTGIYVEWTDEASATPAMRTIQGRLISTAAVRPADDFEAAPICVICVKANEVYRFHVADVAQPDILPEPYGGFARGDHFHLAFGLAPTGFLRTISGTARKNARPNILIFGGLGRLTHPVRLPICSAALGESP